MGLLSKIPASPELSGWLRESSSVTKTKYSRTSVRRACSARSSLSTAAKDIVPPSTGDGTIDLGNVGLIGNGRGSQPQPRVRLVDGKAKIDRGLDRDAIRRVVRAHIHEVRFCYNRGLVQDSTLRGRVAVTFTITADGSVAKSKVASHTVTDPVATCIASRIAGWTFPGPTNGGTVNVTCPFVLEPDT